MELKNILNEYRDLTLEMITSIENEEYNNADVLIEKRKQIIDCLQNLNYNQQQFKAASDELKLLLLEQKLAKLIGDKRIKLKAELNKISNSKKAQKSYNKKFATNSVYFNKEI